MKGAMKGLHINFGLLNLDQSPLFTYDETMERWHGYLPDFIEALSKVMDFSYTLIGGTAVGARPRTGPGGRTAA